MASKLDDNKPLWVNLKAKHQVSPAKILSRFRVKHPPIPIDEIAATLGVNVEYVINVPWDAALSSTENQASIWINAKAPRTTQRFALALHPNGIIYRDPATHNPDFIKERQANAFAYKILMPEELLLYYVHLGFFTFKIADAFKVPYDILNLRLEELGYG